MVNAQKSPAEKRPTRDFIFVDESGDPGQLSDYYIVGLLHVTNLSIEKLNVHLGAFRYFGNVESELKSGSMKPARKDRLFHILKFTQSDNIFVKASASYVHKKNYKGAHLGTNSTHFRHYVLRRALETHFRAYPPASFTGTGPGEIELIIDRFHGNEHLEALLRKYLRTDKFSPLPPLLHITMADSRYVELLQVADWIAGCVKSRIFKQEDLDMNIFDHIFITEIQN